MRRVYRTENLVGIAAILVAILAVNAGCALEEPGVDPPKRAIFHPIGLAVHPSERFAVVVNSNFNLAYRNGTISVIDLTGSFSRDERGDARILGEFTVPIGSFGAMATFDSAGNRLYVTVRGERKESETTTHAPADALYVFSVNEKALDEGGELLKEVQVLPISPDPFGIAISADDRFLFITHLSGGEVSIVQTAPGEPVDPQLKTQFYHYDDEVAAGNERFLTNYCLPEHWRCDEPYPTSGTCALCKNQADCQGGGICLNPVHQSDLDGYCVYPCTTDADCGPGFLCLALHPARAVSERKLDPGLDFAAVHPLTGSVYLSSRYTGSIGVLRTYYREGRPVEAYVESFSAIEGSDIRALAFAMLPNELAGGVQVLLLAAARNANEYPALVAIDATEDASQFDMRTNRGKERNLVLDFLPTCAAPSDVKIWQNLAFVSCSGSDTIEVFDLIKWRLADRIVVATIEPDRSMYPYELALFRRTDNSVNLIVAGFKGHELQIWQITRTENGSVSHTLLTRIHNHAIEY